MEIHKSHGLDFANLKAKQRSLRSSFPEALGLRVHRSISWLERAEREAEDPDAAFAFYWIAFNAAYAADIQTAIGPSERSSFDAYFERLIGVDKEKRIYGEIWNRFAGPVRLLLDNRYVFQPFWNHHNGIDGYADWAERLERSRAKLQTALAHQDTKLVLTTLFDRLYVLRNQLLHGGATWGSSVNREQVQDGARILQSLVPIFVDLMLDNPKLDWGAPFYPVIKD